MKAMYNGELKGLSEVLPLSVPRGKEGSRPITCGCYVAPEFTRFAPVDE